MIFKESMCFSNDIIRDIDDYRWDICPHMNEKIQAKTRNKMMSRDVVILK